MMGNVRTAASTVTEAMKCELPKIRTSGQTNGHLMFPTPKRALPQTYNIAFGSLIGSVTKIFPLRICQD